MAGCDCFLRVDVEIADKIGHEEHKAGTKNTTL